MKVSPLLRARRSMRSVSAVSVVAGVLILGGTLAPLGPANAVADRTPGTAIANAGVLGVAPVVSGANLTVSLGSSQALYQSGNSQASSQALNMGGLGAFMTSFVVCNTVLLKPSQLPAALVVDTNDGATEAHRSVNLVGTEKAEADPEPLASHAETSPVALAVPGVISISGTSSASTRYDASTGTGSATASSNIGISLFGGLLRIDGVSWTATQTLGQTRESKSDFSIGKVSVQALPGVETSSHTLIPTKSAEALVKLVNGLLAPFGLSLVLPEESIDPQTKTLTLSPLKIRISGSALDRALTKPVFDSFFKLETLLFDPLPATTDCTKLEGLLRSFQGPTDAIATVLAGISEGTGAAEILIGGVNVNVRPPSAYRNPFGDDGGAGEVKPPPGGKRPAQSGKAPVAAAPLPDVAAAPGAPAAGDPVITDPEIAPTAASRLICRSENESGGACSSGRAVAAGAMALLLGAGLFGAEFGFERRTSRRTKRRAQL